MKELIIGDIHLGNPSHLNFQIPFLKSMIDYANENNIKCVTFLGDIFDNRTSTNTLALHAFNDTLQSLYNSNIEVIILKGNHDLYYRKDSKVSPLDIVCKGYDNIQLVSDSLRIDNRLYIGWQFDTDTLPKLMKDDIVYGHFEIKDFYMTKTYKSTHGFDLVKFKDVKQVFSGHYHTKQVVGNIMYTGTPYQLNYSDFGDVKCLHVYDHDTNEIKVIDTMINTHLKAYVENGKIRLYMTDDIEISIDDDIRDCVITLYVEKDIKANRDHRAILEDLCDNPIKYVVKPTKELKEGTVSLLTVHKSVIDTLVDLADDDMKEMLASIINEAKARANK